MKLTKLYIKTIQNYLKKLGRSDGIPPLKIGKYWLDFSPKRLAKSMMRIEQMCTEELLPYSVVEKRVDKSSIFYIMGLTLYNALTQEKFYGTLQHSAIKHPFIYQFLHMALIQEAKHIETYIQKFEHFEADQKKTIPAHGEKHIEIFSSIGFQSFKNDDRYYAKKIGDSASLLIIADGMGGTQEGKLASTKAITLFSSLLLQQTLSDKSPQAIEELLQNTILSVNQSIIQLAKEQNIELGTTLTAVLIINDTYHIGHIGDSRVYKLSGTKVEQLSTDHSMVVVMHAINYSKNTLAYAIGKAFDASHIFTTHGVLEEGSQLLLCSDGFWESLEEEHFGEEMESVINHLFDKLPQDNVTFIRFSPHRKPKRRITIKWHFIIIALLIAIATIIGNIYSTFQTYPMELKVSPSHVKVLIDGKPYTPTKEYRIQRHDLLIQAQGYHPKTLEMHTHQKSEEVVLKSSHPKLDFGTLYPLQKRSFFMVDWKEYKVEHYRYVTDEEWYRVRVFNDQVFGLVVLVDIVLKE